MEVIWILKTCSTFPLILRMCEVDLFNLSSSLNKVFVWFRADIWSVGFRADWFERDWRDKDSTTKPADDKNVSIKHNGHRHWVIYLQIVRHIFNSQLNHHTLTSTFGEKRSLGAGCELPHQKMISTPRQTHMLQKWYFQQRRKLVRDKTINFKIFG